MRLPNLFLVLASGAWLACGVPVEPATEDFVGMVKVDGLERAFQVHLPEGYDGSVDLPVIVALHGAGGSGTQMRLSSGFDLVSDELNFVVVYPEGEPNWEIQEDGSAPDDVKFLRAMLDRLGERVSVDRDRVTATGMSRGGFMSHFLGCRMSDDLAAVAPVAGGLLIDVAGYCNSDRSIGVLAVHGEVDQIVPIAGDPNAVSEYYSLEDGLNFWARLNACGSTVNLAGEPSFGPPIQRISYSGCRDGVRVEGLRMEGVAHRWPNRTINGSKVIAEFLLDHHR